MLDAYGDLLEDATTNPGLNAYVSLTILIPGWVAVAIMNFFTVGNALVNGYGLVLPIVSVLFSVLCTVLISRWVLRYAYTRAQEALRAQKAYDASVSGASDII
jgi:Flp pilus assembly protein TadB